MAERGYAMIAPEEGARHRTRRDRAGRRHLLEIVFKDQIQSRIEAIVTVAW
jgi:hypothetical protein